MKSNIEKAVLLIASLSLLLGLSLGQIHKQHRQIKTLKQQSGQSIVQINSFKEPLFIRQHPCFRNKELPSAFDSYRDYQKKINRSVSNDFRIKQSLETTLIDLEDLNKEMKSLEVELEKLQEIHPVIEITIPEIQFKK